MATKSSSASVKCVASERGSVDNCCQVDNAEARLLAELLDEHARCLRWLLRVETAAQALRPGVLSRDSYHILRNFLLRRGCPQQREECIQAIIDGGGVLMARNKVKEAGKAITFRVRSGELVEERRLIWLPEWKHKG